jgi:probable HAF family extracellular repeat protein
MRLPANIHRLPGTILATAALALAAIGPAPPAEAGVASQFNTFDLGISGSAAAAINDSRQVAGYFRTSAGHYHPFLWQDGKLTDLGVLAHGSFEFGYAHDINRHGHVVGQSAVAGGEYWAQSHAFVWRDGVMTDLGTLGGSESAAFRINDRGQILGFSSSATGEPHAVLWEHGRIVDLGVESASDINNRGQVVGAATINDEYGVYLWQAGRVTSLGVPMTYADAINDRGWIVGADWQIFPHAYLWRAGTVTDLGTLGGGTGVVDVNERGQVLGASDVSEDGPSHAFIWEGGRMTDLTPHGIPEWPNLTGFNNRGDICGYAYVADDSHAVVYLHRSV